ncbi:uncharacterized protein LOC118191291 isoform X3 [Stegodyphus dumicola]|uniref:uncharacterized protein LOC118191291 isoform X3 n=1 Tax=Stegodyphus dumicola TaxID=202533 RepID=UPI0015B21BB6|nr:uncharacterized protein LOC118191291 isoform X3 [Stegodyphus dumicola]
MDITGLVVAASEGIQLENGKGLLYKIYNQTENIHIFLLACGSVHYWANIFVNRYYNFTGLRAGIFESLSGSRKFLLKTSPNSNYLEIQQQQVKKLKMSSKLKRIISVPDVKALYNSEMNFRSKLISYQGTITDVKVPGFGIYELDNKIKLYATLNAFRSSLNSLSVGAQVLVSNIHLLSISKDEKILVCCGLSSIKKMNFQDLSEKKEGLISDLKYPPRCNLSIYDILWLEELFSRLNSKFSVDIVAGDSSFLYTTEFFYNILEYFCSPVADMLSIRLSLAEEFCSHPHKCSAFSEDTLSTGYVIPYISEILDEAALRISWEEHSKNWRTSSVCNISGSGYHIDEEIEYYSINDVFSKRNLTNYCIVKAIIIDKFFEEKYTKLHHGHSQLTLKTTLCLKLADSFYENPIHAYVPYHHNILGLLPGVKVKLYGFLCCCSKKGFLYLRASTMFGIQVENSGTLTEITTSFDSSNWNQMKSISNGEIIIMDLLGKVVLDGAFRCLCFILKIISAEIILSCAKCSRNSRENCTCWAPYVLKTRVSMLIDDGSKEMHAHCSDKTAKKILMLEGDKWDIFVSFVEQEQNIIKYHNKMPEEQILLLPFINQVFCAYCSSKLLCRQIFLNCETFPMNDRRKENFNSVWCNDVVDFTTKDLMTELYMRVKDIKTGVT